MVWMVRVCRSIRFLRERLPLRLPCSRFQTVLDFIECSSFYFYSFILSIAWRSSFQPHAILKSLPGTIFLQPPKRSMAAMDYSVSISVGALGGF
jgi:hypothetical protein